MKMKSRAQESMAKKLVEQLNKKEATKEATKEAATTKVTKEASIPSTWKVAPDGAHVGTSRQGEIDIAYADLVRIFGEPHTNGDGYKIDAEWIFETPAGTVTIYNYKSGPNYNEGQGSVNEIRDWHIGGNSKKVFKEVIEALKAGGVPALEASKEATDKKAYSWMEHSKNVLVDIADKISDKFKPEIPTQDQAYESISDEMIDELTNSIALEIATEGTMVLEGGKNASYRRS